MFGDKYGPFTQTLAIVAILTTVFTGLALKAIGKLSQWTFLVHDSPAFLVAGGARVLAIALIAASFIFIDTTNYHWFLSGAIFLGVLMMVFVAWLDLLRKQHLCKVPQINANGSQAKTFWGKEKFKMVVIGDVTDMKPDASAAYRKLAISPCKFISGYGQNGVNDAAAIWPMDVLAKNSTRMTTLLMSILLCAALGLFLAASAIEVHLRSSASITASPAK